jgi:hypothetical protein
VLYRIKPSKPAAVFGAVFGAAIIIFGVTQAATSHHMNGGFMVLWAVLGVAIISFNLWAAFSKNGSTGTVMTRAPESNRTSTSNLTGPTPQ